LKDFVKDNNSFKNISFIKFWLISYLFFMTFPLSLIFCFVYLGTTKTKQFLVALVNDFLQTLLIISITLSITIYFIFDYISKFF
jgi:hypothetical protein